jgi:hypothetical protein
MSLRQQQNFLAKLYTDENLRRAFFIEPEKIGAENGLSAKEIEELAAVLPDELNFFAESLFWKRLRAVKKFLPLTSRVLGEDFETEFREFSHGFNPRTIKKHLEDALGFCEFLLKKDVSRAAKSAARHEKTRLEFFNFGKKFAVCRLDFELVTLQKGENPVSGFKRKTKFAVWIRVGNQIKHFVI